MDSDDLPSSPIITKPYKKGRGVDDEPMEERPSQHRAKVSPAAAENNKQKFNFESSSKISSNNTTLNIDREKKMAAANYTGKSRVGSFQVTYPKDEENKNTRRKIELSELEREKKIALAGGHDGRRRTSSAQLKAEDDNDTNRSSSFSAAGVARDRSRRVSVTDLEGEKRRVAASMGRIQPPSSSQSRVGAFSVLHENSTVEEVASMPQAGTEVEGDINTRRVLEISDLEREKKIAAAGIGGRKRSSTKTVLDKDDNNNNSALPGATVDGQRLRSRRISVNDMEREKQIAAAGMGRRTQSLQSEAQDVGATVDGQRLRSRRISVNDMEREKQIAAAGMGRRTKSLQSEAQDVENPSRINSQRVRLSNLEREAILTHSSAARSERSNPEVLYEKTASKQIVHNEFTALSTSMSTRLNRNPKNLLENEFSSLQTNMQHGPDTSEPIPRIRPTMVRPGAHRVGGSFRDDDDGANTVYMQEESTRTDIQLDSTSGPMTQIQERYTTVENYGDEMRSGEESGQNTKDDSEQIHVMGVDPKVEKRKYYLGIFLVVLILVAITLGGVFLFMNRDKAIAAAEQEKIENDAIQQSMKEMEKLILRKLPNSLDSLSDKSTPQYKALLWVAKRRVEYLKDYTDSRSLLQYGLRAFYESTKHGNVSSDVDECNWDGVTCTRKGSIDLVFETHYWIGTLPPEIGLLPLRILTLTNGFDLHGSIPTEIGLSTTMRKFSITDNKLSGAIPSEIGLLTDLKILHLSKNNINGSMPSEIGLLADLELLDFYKNKIKGSIPSEIGLMVKSRRLNFDDNNITGAIPSEIGLLPKVMSLIFAENSLSGTIPSEIVLRKRRALERLSLMSNKLSGQIPTEIGTLKNFTYLELSYNQFTGLIPTELGKLSSLTYLGLRSNKLSGSVPTEFGPMTNLKSFALTGNPELSGSLSSICEYVGNDPSRRIDADRLILDCNCCLCC